MKIQKCIISIAFLFIGKGPVEIQDKDSRLLFNGLGYFFNGFVIFPGRHSFLCGIYQSERCTGSGDGYGFQLEIHFPLLSHFNANRILVRRVPLFVKRNLVHTVLQAGFIKIPIFIGLQLKTDSGILEKYKGYFYFF